MALFGFFRKLPPIRTTGELADFIDEQAAYLMQKGIYEYARARTGPHAKKMLFEDDFHRSVDRARWSAFPLGLVMVGEMVEGVLWPHSGENAEERRAVIDELIDLVLSVFDRYPVPEAVGRDAWLDSRSEVALKLDQISMHPPKRVIDIPEPYGERYFAMMPIHEVWRSRDAPTTLNFLKLNLVNIRDELVKRMDAAAMVEQLRRSEAQPE